MDSIRDRDFLGLLETTEDTEAVLESFRGLEADTICWPREGFFCLMSSASLFSGSGSFTVVGFTTAVWSEEKNQVWVLICFWYLSWWSWWSTNVWFRGHACLLHPLGAGVLGDHHVSLCLEIVPELVPDQFLLLDIIKNNENRLHSIYSWSITPSKEHIRAKSKLDSNCKWM